MDAPITPPPSALRGERLRAAMGIEVVDAEPAPPTPRDPRVAFARVAAMVAELRAGVTSDGPLSVRGWAQWVSPEAHSAPPPSGVRSRF